ncbi:MAG TPA: PQQ-binding-like beta-propeller repeat protein [Gemmataceae bacterium]|nr:PQQ-binding-like beta-propeller repeat protein [Gemmataceae bacterium]
MSDVDLSSEAESFDPEEMYGCLATSTGKLMLMVAVALACGLVIQEAGLRAQQNGQARTDRYGDPLPEGAVSRLGTLRFRQPFWVSGLAFTPDGKTLAASCWDGTARLWDPATGKQKRCLRRLPNPIPGQGRVAFLGVAVTPDGKQVVAVENHSTVHVWEIATGKEVRRLEGHYGFGMALSPDGKTLAVGESGESGTQFVLWDLATGQQRHVFGAAKLPVSALAFSPDSKLIAAGDEAGIGPASVNPFGTIRLWDIAAERVRHVLSGHAGGATAVAFSPDGRQLVSASHDSTLRFWDPATGALVRKVTVTDGCRRSGTGGLAGLERPGVDHGGILAVAYAPRGRWLASGSADGTVRLWDPGTGKLLRVLGHHGREVTSVRFSPDGKVLASGGFDQTIRLWDPASGRQLQRRDGQDGPVHDMAVSPDGRLLAVTCEDQTIRLWDVATGKQEHILRGHVGSVYAVAFSRDGRLLASGGADGTVRIWDTASGRERHRLPKQRNMVFAVAWTAKPNLVVSTEAGGTLRFWDWTTSQEQRSIPLRGNCSVLQVSADGNLLAAGDSAGAYIWDLTTGKERRFAGSLPHFGFTADGRTLVTKSWRENVIRIWDTVSGEEVALLPTEGKRHTIADLSYWCLSPDGAVLAGITPDQTIELWELCSGKRRRHFVGHDGMTIRCLAFSADGRTLFSGATDTTVLAWDVARRLERQPAQLNAQQLRESWQALGGETEQADRAIWTLAAAPASSVPFIARHLRPVEELSPKLVHQLLADLNSAKFATREKATAELARLGERARPAMRQALGRASPEARLRLERLLRPIRSPVANPDRLRALRAVEVLEHAATPQARDFLETLSRGATGARLKRAATAAVGRLAKRSISLP